VIYLLIAKRYAETEKEKSACRGFSAWIRRAFLAYDGAPLCAVTYFDS
jgi:hypothetical protein